jgi:hypothetical protein
VVFGAVTSGVTGVTPATLEVRAPMSTASICECVVLGMVPGPCVCTEPQPSPVPSVMVECARLDQFQAVLRNQGQEDTIAEEPRTP